MSSPAPSSVASAKTSSKFKSLDHIQDPNLAALHKMLSKHALPRDDPRKSNFCSTDPNFKRRFLVPDEEIPNLMQLVKTCVDKGITLHLTELQASSDDYTVGSGLMLDFDILTDTEEFNYDSLDIDDLIQTVYSIYHEILDMGQLDSMCDYAAVIKKPFPVYKEELKKYKHGLHVLLPCVQTTKMVKKYVFKKLVDESTYAREFQSSTGLIIKDVLDTGSITVPVYLIGSCKNSASIPYEVNCAYEIKYKPGSNVFKVKALMNGIHLDNWAYEFSLNHAVEGSCITKRLAKPKKEVFSDIQHFMTCDSTFDNELEQAKGDLMTKSLYNPDIQNMKHMLSMLSLDRIGDRNTWRDLIYALASEGPEYRSLALWVSKRTPDKFDMAGFNSLWDEAINYRGTKKFTIKSIHFWAQNDSPELYSTFRVNSIYGMIRSDVQSKICFGRLQHTEMSRYIHFMFKNKYVTDNTMTGDNWYEFVTEHDQDISPGQLYKWRVVGKTPDSLLRYMADELPQVCKQVLDDIDTAIDESDSDDKTKMLVKMRSTYHKSIQQLSNGPYKTAILKEAESRFRLTSFVKKLDKIPNVMGVGNGVIEFVGHKINLLSQHHNYPVSLYSETFYTEYDPNNKYVKQVLALLKSMFPENELDAYEYIMYYLSTSLDGFPKDSLFLILTGVGSNGKSFLMEFLKETLGNMYVRKLPIAFITEQYRNKSAGANSALMELKHARLAIMSESEKNERLNAAAMKEYTGKETLSGRELFKSQENFKPNANFVVTTNNRLSIESTDFAIWRRIITYKLKMVFVSTLKGDNEFERLGDPELTDKCLTDKRYQEAFLSILADFRTKLYRDYGGNLSKVPRPTIDKETAEYRNKEDIVNRFIDAKCYYSEGTEQSLDEIVSIYTTYYKMQSNQKCSGTKEDIKSQFLNSQLVKYLRTTNGVTNLIGFKILDDGTSPSPGEILMVDYLASKNQS